MLFNCEILFSLLAVCCSCVTARPGPLVPRAFSNTTLSSTTISTSISSTETTSLPTSVKSITSGSSSVVFNSVSSPTSVTSGSPTSHHVLTTTLNTVSTVSRSPAIVSSGEISTPRQVPSLSANSSSTSSPLTISSSTSFSVTSSKNSTAVSRSHSLSQSTITSTRSSSSKKGSISVTTSHSTASACHPVTTHDVRGSVCISYCAITTYFAYAPNITETVTQVLFLKGNSTSLYHTLDSKPSQELPPQPCTTPPADFTSATAVGTHTGLYTTPMLSSPESVERSYTILYVTSKTTVTSTVSLNALGFGGSSVNDKTTVPPSGPTTTSSLQSPLVKPTEPQSLDRPLTPTPSLQEVGPATKPTTSFRPNGLLQTQDNPSLPTVTVNGVTIILPGSSVIIGDTTVAPNIGTTAITANGNAFTINPSQVIAKGTTIARPATSPVALVNATPTPTVVNGVTVAVGPSVAVVGSSTYNIGPGANPTTAVINGQTISIGPAGVQIGSTTLKPAISPTPPPTTQVTTINGIPLTQIGSSVVVLGSQTFTLTALPAHPTTETLNGATISIGPSGIAIIGGNSGGAGTTITPPRPAATTTAATTKVITAGGITFSEIGSSLVVIGTKTFTVGPGATPTTDVVGSVTASLGPGGVGFAGSSTTIAVGGGGAGGVSPAKTVASGALPSSSDGSSGSSSAGMRVSARGSSGGLAITLAFVVGIWALV